jgi:hypothetical protein
MRILIALVARIYTAMLKQSADLWLIEVPEVPGTVCQATRFEDVHVTARKATALKLDVPEAEVGIDVVLRLIRQASRFQNTQRPPQRGGTTKRGSPAGNHRRD